MAGQTFRGSWAKPSVGRATNGLLVPLRSVGLPLNPLDRALMALVGLIVGLVLYAALSSEGRLSPLQVQETASSAALIVMWAVRRVLRGRHFVEGSSLRISADGLRVPGFLVGRPDDVVIRRSEVRGLSLRTLELQLGGGKVARSLDVETSTAAGTVQIPVSCLGMDLGRVVAQAEALLQKSCRRASEELGVQVSTSQGLWIVSLCCVVGVVVMMGK